MLVEDTNKEQAATARIIGASYCQSPPSSRVTWDHTETEPNNFSGNKNSLSLATLSSSAPPIWYMSIFFCLWNYHLQFRMTGKETVPNFVHTTCWDITEANRKKNVGCFAWSRGHLLHTWQLCLHAKDPVPHRNFPLILQDCPWKKNNFFSLSWGSSFSLLHHKYIIGQ